VRVEWKKLDKNEQSEIAKEAKTVVQMINGRFGLNFLITD
jgi:hypothetical protein